tara:strand:+ start:7 stop:165 length:159 start_codon:yes stop_codon:yes gene_type:complete
VVVEEEEDKVEVILHQPKMELVVDVAVAVVDLILDLELKVLVVQQHINHLTL